MRRLSLPTVLILCLLVQAAAQEFVTRVYVLNAIPAESAAEAVRPLLSAGGQVVPETRLNKLVVRDSLQVQAEVERLLPQIDQHLPQVRVFVNMHGVAENRGGFWAVGVDSVGRDPRVTGTAVATTSRSSVTSEQNLVVMSGERGMIHFARDLVNADPYVQFAVGAGLLPPGFAVQTVGTGFAVEPLVQGEVVRLRITPWLGFQTPGGRSEVFVHEAATTLAVERGQTVTVSSSGYGDELRSRAFGLVFGSGVRTGSGTAAVTLRPEILDY